MTAASNSTTQAELRAQWINPGDILSVLLLIGGDIVQKAIAQSIGYEAHLCETKLPGAKPKSMFAIPLNLWRFPSVGSHSASPSYLLPLVTGD